MKHSNSYKYIFLDRDGVINVERKNDYVKNIAEFVFEEKALEAIAILSKYTGYIFIVTNQRGVGRGKMSLADLDEVHDYMLQKIQEVGGRIKQIYFCTDTDPSSINRKPNIGMAFKALTDYPQVDFSESVMVGNSKSDMLFGKKAGMYTVLVGNKYKADDPVFGIADSYFANLYEFALSL